MKQGRTLCIGVMAALALAAVCPAAQAGTAFTFGEGVTWASAVADVFAAEDVADTHQYAPYELNGYQIYDFYGGDETALQTEYAFLDGALAFAAVCYDADDGFVPRKSVLAALYGAPDETDPAHFSTLFAAVAADTLAADELENFAGWALADGTQVYLLTYAGSDYLFCFNEPLVLQADAAAEPAFTFRSGITWDTTPDELLAAEGADADTYETADYEEYRYTVTGDDGEAMQVAYGYADGRMIYVGTHYLSSAADETARRLTELVVRYGTPPQTDATQALSLFAVLEPEGIDADTLTKFAGWTLDDGTQLCLMERSGETYVFYLNEDRIAALGETEQIVADPQTTAPAGTAIRNGLTWAATPEQMQAAETITDETWYFTYTSGDYRYYQFNHDADNETVIYAYLGGTLTAVTLRYDGAADRFNEQYDSLSAQYGTPADADRDTLRTLLDSAAGQTVDTDSVSAYANWMLAGGTRVSLLACGDQLLILYLNTNAAASGD
ncbi:MAG TPA: hypothetical protein PK537_07750 [Candidatus Limiplasma sp.]|nr:hypothetical protein [Candidatus Limiplasma sp.]